jgi:proteasome lid subunit RPN8/RPN11
MSGEAATPWIRGELVIGRAELDEIEAHAAECYPSECCGFIVGPVDDGPALDQVIREVNEADKYHALDPERFPRTSKTYFKINELRAARAFDDGDAKGQPIKVIYHSHCDAGAYFSSEDAATFASQGELMWPCAFLVVSVVGGEVQGHRLWAHVPGTNAFRETSLTIR